MGRALFSLSINVLESGLSSGLPSLHMMTQMKNGENPKQDSKVLQTDHCTLDELQNK